MSNFSSMRVLLAALFFISSLAAQAQCTVSVTATNATCFGYCDGSAVASGSNGTAPYTFDWSNNVSNDTITNLCAGTYIVTMTDNIGCTDYDTITITQFQALQINQTVTSPSCSNCFDGSALLNVSGGGGNYAYTWCTGATTPFTNIGLGCCVFNVYDVSTGCMQTDSVCATLSVCGTAIIANNQVVCSNTPSIISYNTDSGTYNFSWTNNNSLTGIPSSGTGDSINISPNDIGVSIIYIEATDPTNNCPTLYDTITISVNETPSLNLTTDTTICLGNQLVLVATGQPSGGTLLWNTQETTDSIIVSPASSTLFSVSYQTINGCSITDSVLVNIATLDNFNLVDTTICQGGTVLLTAGANSVSCDLAEPICSSSSINFPNLINTTAPVGNNYECLGTQPNPSWFYMQIDQPGDLTLDIVQTSNFGGSGLDVDFILYGPYTSYAEATSYCGNLGAATSGSGLNTVVDCSYSAASTENVNITGAQTGEVYVMMLTNFANESGFYNIIQTSGSASLDCSILNTNTSPTTYLWSSGETTPWITVIPSNTNMYAVTVTSNGCEFMDSSLVTVNPTPTVSVNNATISSIGQSATLTAVGSPTGGTYLWNPAGQTTSSITVSPTTTTDYVVTYTLNGCSSETTATVDVTVGIVDHNKQVISIYPNPAQNKLTLKVDEKIIGNFYLIIDSQGRILKREAIESTTQDIHISDFKNGLYTIQIGSSNLKFIKN